MYKSQKRPGPIGDHVPAKCPHCGYCESCGRSNQTTPYYPGPYWYGTPWQYPWYRPVVTFGGINPSVNPGWNTGVTYSFPVTSTATSTYTGINYGASGTSQITS